MVVASRPKSTVHEIIAQLTTTRVAIRPRRRPIVASPVVLVDTQSPSPHVEMGSAGPASSIHHIRQDSNCPLHGPPSRQYVGCKRPSTSPASHSSSDLGLFRAPAWRKGRFFYWGMAGCGKAQ
ncbi:hypothetical protein RirG_031820 [Rhizophagus irregularis DAOM 197198w]|uniref:Uncharacterized protein n=1 Tax=Rhizophagus irregularis (strain DAOM 197198w) TaxID=1432141 RepID=A0A015KAI0_RHIIW|nr:hypothetical protein RirG_031820 [Rhizophagus irregularis DAOM 197198w]